jgi:transposase-like protein
MAAASYLTPIQSQVLAGLLSGASVAAVARGHHIHGSTIYAWRTDLPAFRFALASARSRQKAILYDSAQELAARAFETLNTLLASASETVRLRAAEAVLRTVDPLSAAEPPPGVNPGNKQAFAEQHDYSKCRESLLPSDRDLLDSGSPPHLYPNVACLTKSDTIRQNPTESDTSSVWWRSETLD